MKVKLSLHDGFLEIDPFPEDLKEELRYWKKELKWNPETHKREVLGHYESLLSVVDGKAVAMPGHAHRVLEWLRAHHMEVEFEDKRLPFPEPDMDRAMAGLRDYQKEIVLKMLLARGGILKASTGLGKALPNTARIPTPQGWRTVGDIQVGDQLLGANGQPTTVLAVYPQEGPQQVYEVEFSDGRIVECCKDHLWKWMPTPSSRRAWRVTTTTDMQSHLQTNRKPGEDPKVPLCSPIVYRGKQLPVDPYVLGALLGNGCLKEQALTISSGNEFVPAKVASILGGTLHKCHAHNFSYNIWLPERERTAKGYWKKRFATVDVLTGCCEPLVGAGSGTKYIPEPYLLSSADDRLRLMQGLLDTDGSVDDKGRVSYSTTSRKLAYGLAELAYSLGMLARVTKQPRTKYRSGEEFGVYFRCRPEFKPQLVTLPEKLARVAQGQARGNRHEKNEVMRVVDVRATSRYEEMTCFKVDASDSLFLCDNYVVTHNTFMAARILDAFSHEEMMLRGTPLSVFAAPSKDITKKNAEEVAKLLPHRDVGLIMSGINRPSDDIQVITLDSLHRLNPLEVGLLIVDEMHTSASDSRAADILKFVNARKYGVSATPLGRFDGKDPVAEGLFGPIVVQKNYKDGVEAGALVPIEVIWVNSPEPSVGMGKYMLYKTRDGKVKAGSINNHGQNRIIAQILRLLPHDVQCLVITQFIEHMHHILQYCDDDVAYAHAQTSDKELRKFPGVKAISAKERNEIYARIASGEMKKVVSTHIFKEGVNFVHLNVVVNASGGGSDIAAAQIPGRASRKSEGKDKAYMVEFWHPWDTDLGKAGPLLAADKQRRKVYNELGFKQSWIEPEQLKSMEFLHASPSTSSTAI